MKAGVYYNNRDVRAEERPVPRIGEEDILLKVMASGICGSDLMEWYRVKKAPLVLGHEVAGVIEKTGKNAKNFKKGDKVMATHHVSCNECNRCLAGNHTSCELLHKTNFEPGGFAEYLRIPAINIEKGGVLKLPENVSFEEGTFIEPLACVLRSHRLANLTKGRSVLVIGSGIAGLLHIKAAKAGGVEKIFATDISGYRLEYAKKFGADAVFSSNGFSPEKLKGENNGALADIVILCTGASPAVAQAFECVEPGGIVVLFAIPRPEDSVPFPYFNLWKTSIAIISSYAASPSDLKESLKMMADSKIAVGDMITHRLPLERIGEGFRLAAGAGNALKIIITPHPA